MDNKFEKDVSEQGTVPVTKIKESRSVVEKPKGKWTKAKETIDTVVCLVLVAVAIYFVGGFVHQHMTGDVFFPFGYRIVKILGGSMEDTLEAGALVIVEETKDIEKNDIVFFVNKDGSFVIHRYVDDAENGNYITRGDANSMDDWIPITEDQLQGKVVVVMNWMSGITSFFDHYGL